MFTRAALQLLPCLPVVAVATALDQSPVVKYGLTGVLAVLMYWLGKLGSRLVDEHIASLGRRDAAATTQAAALLIVAEELRKRPCMATSDELQDMADRRVHNEGG